MDLSTKVDGFLAQLNNIETRCNQNTAEIFSLKESNFILVNKNETLQVEINRQGEEIGVLSRQLEGVDQYLRVNNVEIIGLTEPEGDETDEDVVIKAINGMIPPTPLTPKDIDICHVLPSKRNDKKRVLVCKFISRKTKVMVINTKKDNRDYKYQGNTFFVNDHLSPANKKLFEQAKLKKIELNYKYQWTKNGYVYLRYSDRSPSIKITSQEILNSLRMPSPSHLQPINNGDE